MGAGPGHPELPTRKAAELIRGGDVIVYDRLIQKIGGGFPEVQASALAANSGFVRFLHEAAQNGLPIYAECGGLMVH